jgi:bis(5'-nucleosyl)-tetraphosphatase (symmetrical)
MVGRHNQHCFTPFTSALMQFLSRKARSTRVFATVIGLPLVTSAFLLGWHENNNCPTNVVGNRQQLHVLGGSTTSSCRYHRHFSSSDRNNLSSAAGRRPTTLSSSVVVLASSAAEYVDPNLRTRQTPLDEYFQKHGPLDGPAVPHMILPPREEEDGGDGDNNLKTILVIGDVHGCYEEMHQLHSKALLENDSMPFDYVILVGDMCNKGPESAKVVRWVRTQPNWYTVRGNHDDGALLAALGDEKKLAKGEKYQWVTETAASSANDDGDENKVFLSDHDVLWMSQLPYTITIPGSYLGEDVDTIIVHAGLIPNKGELDRQHVQTMITVRNIAPTRNANSASFPQYRYFGSKSKPRTTEGSDGVPSEPIPWASAWKGPQRVIFGHDARRGLQQYEGDWALGLDSGAVYGNGMTGVILPQRKLVFIETQVHQTVD